MSAFGTLLMQRIGKARYRLWFDGKTRISRQGDLLVVSVPNKLYQEWLKRVLSETIGEVAQETFGCFLEVQFVIDPELNSALTSDPNAKTIGGPIDRGISNSQNSPIMDSTSGSFSKEPELRPTSFPPEYWSALARFKQQLPELLLKYPGKWAAADAESVFRIGDNDWDLLAYCKELGKKPGTFIVDCIMPEADEIEENSSWLP